MYYSTLEIKYNGTTPSLQTVYYPLAPCQLKPQFKPIEFKPAKWHHTLPTLPTLPTPHTPSTPTPKWEPSETEVIQRIKESTISGDLQQLNCYSKRYLETHDTKQSDWDILIPTVLFYQNCRKNLPQSFLNYLNKEAIYKIELHCLKKVVFGLNKNLIWDQQINEIITNTNDYVSKFTWFELLPMMDKHQIVDLQNLVKEIRWMKLNFYKNKFLNLFLCRPQIVN